MTLPFAATLPIELCRHFTSLPYAIPSNAWASTSVSALFRRSEEQPGPWDCCSGVVTPAAPQNGVIGHRGAGGVRNLIMKHLSNI